MAPVVMIAVPHHALFIESRYVKTREGVLEDVFDCVDEDCVEVVELVKLADEVDCVLYAVGIIITYVVQIAPSAQF
jgi:hypothetical protein